MKLVFLALVFLLLASGCLQPVSESIKELQEVEVREYEGENLSSVGDFRENSIRGPQDVDIDSYSLRVHGLVENEARLSYESVLNNQKYSKVVTLYCVEGWSARILWEGILLKDLFEEAGIKPGANTVIFRAVDGYSSSLPLDYVLDNGIMIAYKMNGVVLPPERGFPFQVVAEDKWGYKWVKWIDEIELSNDPGYKGYWESRGYNNDGDVTGPKLE